MLESLLNYILVIAFALMLIAVLGARGRHG